MKQVIYLAFQLILALSLNAQPVVDGFHVYYGNLHNHTAISDGIGTPEEAYTYARDVAHLDFFGLADHANLISSSEWTLTKNTANAFNQDSVFAAFYGFEWTTYLTYGHVTVVNTDDFCSNSSPTANFTGLLNWLSTRNAAAFFNHPGWEIFTLNEFDHFSDSPSSKFVGIELFNDQSGFSKYYYNDGYYSNDGNKGYYDEALIRHWKIGAAGGDDNHSATWGTSKPWEMGVLAMNRTRTDIFNALLAKRFFSTLDRTLVLSMKINGSDMGSTIAGGIWNVVIQAFDQENEVFTQVDLLKNGTIIHSWNPNNTHPLISKSIACANNDYFYVKVKEADGDEAISSPIFISGVLPQPPQVIITNPANGAVYNAGNTVSIIAGATDPDGSINSVKFFKDDVLIGQDNTFPYTANLLVTEPGSYILRAQAYDNAGLSTVSDGVSITVEPVLYPHSLEVPVALSSDDAEENIYGDIALDNTSLSMAENDSLPGGQLVGLIFRNLYLPADALICKAYIRFTAAAASREDCHLQISAQNSSSSATFGNSLYNISERQRTSASVDWNPPLWYYPGDCGEEQQTPELKDIITEVLKCSESALVNDLAFMISGEDVRKAISFDGSPESAPRLFLEYISETGSQPVAKKSEIAGKPGPGNQSSGIDEPVLFPDPVVNNATIRFKQAVDVLSLEIISASGSVVEHRGRINHVADVKINCSAYPAGLYLVRLQIPGQSYTLRFIRKR